MKSKKATIGYLIVKFLSSIEHLYKKNGSETSAFRSWKRTLSILNEHSATRCDHFDRVLITRILTNLKNQGKSHATINLHLRQLKSLFRWGAVHGLVPAWLAQNVQYVPKVSGEKDFTRRRETRSIPLQDVFTLVKHLEATDKETKQQSGISSQALADLVRFQFFTACRPGEALLARPCDFTQFGGILIYTPPQENKLAPQRTIYVGGIAKQIVNQYAKKLRKSDFLFSRPGQPNTPISSATFLRSIQRSCRKAGIEPFAPSRLRNTAGTFLYQHYGHERAMMILGIMSPFTTHIDINSVDVSVLTTWNKKVMESLSLEESQANPNQPVKKSKK